MAKYEDDLHCELCCPVFDWAASYTLFCALAGVPYAPVIMKSFYLEKNGGCFSGDWANIFVNVVYYAVIVIYCRIFGVNFE